MATLPGLIDFTSMLPERLRDESWQRFAPEILPRRTSPDEPGGSCPPENRTQINSSAVSYVTFVLYGDKKANGTFFRILLEVGPGFPPPMPAIV